MSIRISSIGPHERDTWDEYVMQSPQGTAFHRYAALEAQATHSGSTFHPLVGYKGEEPVGLFPVFAMRKGPVPLAFSPPPELGVPYLGPALLNMDKLKQRKREKRHKRFVDGCIEWVDGQIDPQYSLFKTGWRYDDVRPLTWNGFDLDPVYTYVVDVDTDEEELLGRFSQSARRNIRNCLDAEYTVGEGGVDAIGWIVRRMKERYVEQGRAPTLEAAFVSELYESLPDGSVRPYVLALEGEPATGMILLDCGDTARSWLGSSTPDVDLPVNDLLEWRMMCDAMDRGRTEYEIVGANTPRLNNWKTKFSPEIRTGFTAKRSNPGMDVAEQLYLKTRDQNVLAKFKPTVSR
ncbi:GNAT family N-acetyltransferase [Natronococcus wangiae]|uniref:GNAT family N-acetyltransferase n=1 Tax=Natronococcus wangiae TaxID=3068275 RepID=UPI00273D5FB3|nr:GNAT family N-acetyltransferase [Natronococcus sp. AD5]